MEVTFQQHLENMDLVKDVMTEAKQKLDECICKDLFYKYRDQFPPDEEDEIFYEECFMNAISNRYYLMMERIDNNKYHDIIYDIIHPLDENKYFYKMIDYCTKATPYLHDPDVCYNNNPNYVSTAKYNMRLRALAKASYNRDHTLSIRWERVES